MSARTIHQLSGDDAALFELLQELDGEMTPEAEALLEEHLGNLSDKADGYAVIISELQQDAIKFKAEADRLAARASARLNAAQRLKDRLLAYMGEMGREKLEGALFTIARQKNPPSLEVLDEALVPEQFLRVIPESRVVDKKALIAHLKALGSPELHVRDGGFEEIPNADEPGLVPTFSLVARLAEPTFHLRIR